MGCEQIKTKIISLLDCIDNENSLNFVLAAVISASNRQEEETSQD